MSLKSRLDRPLSIYPTRVGSQRHLSKPVESTELVAAIANLMK